MVGIVMFRIDLVKPHMARTSGWIVMFRIVLVKPHMARTSGWHCYV